MAKQVTRIANVNKPEDVAPVTDPVSVKRESLLPGWLSDFKIQAVIIALLAFVLYYNTVDNSYALDDTIVIVQNEYVLEGFAGIPDILTKDGYESYYRQINSSDQVPGGRYRPLSIVTFAIEQQFLGAESKDKVDSVLQEGLHAEMNTAYEQRFLHDMHVRHFFNVVWYILSLLVLLYFLRYVVFKGDRFIPFIAVILFAVHPIHTEVLANVKSRDEILSLLFIGLTFICAFKYKELNRKSYLVAGLISYFLAFLSKEYAITLIVLLPSAFYLFNGYTLKRSMAATLPYLGVIVIYALIRLQIMNGLPPRNELADNDIQINPYAFASGSEKVATEIATSLNYLKLLIFPHPLSADYSYNQIPYKDISHPMVWLSLIIHLGLAYGLYYFFKRRHVLCFAIAFYLFNLLLVNNFLFSIGATMGERLIYHSSLGFIIAVAYLLYKGFERITPVSAGKIGFAGLMLLLIVLCGFKTIDRNKDWKDDYTLFNHDIDVVPNSFLVNINVATTIVNRSDTERDPQKRLADLHRGVALFSKVIAIQDNYVMGYVNRAIAYLKLNRPDSMIADLNQVKRLYPIHPQLPELYFYAGDAYCVSRQLDKGYAVMQTVLQLNPNFTPAKNAIRSIDSLRQITHP